MAKSVISQTAEYALRAMVCLAAEPEKPLTNQQIAEKTRIPAGYLSKVLQALGRGRLVSAQRGLRGGFQLTRSPAAVTIYEIVQAVDPLHRIATCPLGLASHGANLCGLHRRLDAAISLVETAFRESTLADLVEPSTGEHQCGFPPRGRET